MPAKKSNIIMIVLAVVALICAGLSYYITKNIEEFPDKVSEQASAEQAAQSADEGAVDSAPLVEIDVESALEERIMGDPSAPIKISEHASLTCGHCASFHKNIFPAFKEKYLDTGRAYLVYSDFPLNAPALHASKAARCAPEDQYFDFISHLFQTQEEWAYVPDYMSRLKTIAAEYGIDGNRFDSCIANEELQEGIIAGVKAAQSLWDVNATPSFVVNNQIKIPGGHSFEDFDANIVKALDQIEDSTPQESPPQMPEAGEEEGAPE